MPGTDDEPYTFDYTWETVYPALLGISKIILSLSPSTFAIAPYRQKGPQKTGVTGLEEGGRSVIYK